MAARVIVVTSGKGGVGKTTTTANVSVALAKRGQKVVVIDGDIGLRNLDIILGLESRIVFNLVDVVEGSCSLKQALIRDKRVDGLYLLPSPQTRTKDAVTADQMKALCEELSPDFDFILLDSPAGIEAGFRNAAAGAGYRFAADETAVHHPGRGEHAAKRDRLAAGCQHNLGRCRGQLHPAPGNQQRSGRGRRGDPLYPGIGAGCRQCATAILGGGQDPAGVEPDDAELPQSGCGAG